MTSLFPISEASPITFANPQGTHADVVVIGGGVAGVCTAIFLARKGVAVTLFEKGRIAGEQSSRNWGWIRQQGRDPHEMPIMSEAARHWRAFAAETNVDIGLVQGGITYLAKDAKELASYESWLPYAKANGVGSRLLNSDETAALMKGVSRRYAGALHTPEDMRAEPWVAVPALAQIAARAGARLVENCAVRRLDIEAGRVVGVVTEHGRVAAPEVVLAGGAWSALFLRAHGITLPQLSVRATVAATMPLPEVQTGGMADDGLAFRRRQDGGYTLASSGFHELFIGPDAFRALSKFLPQLRADPFGTRFYPAAPSGYPDAWGTARNWNAGDITPFEKMRVLDPKPNHGKVQQIAQGFQTLFPALGLVGISTAWAGMIDTMPDLVPVLDRVAALPGLTVGTGLSGHGFGIGPGVGRVLADLAMGTAPGHDLSRFRFSRFSDGSKIQLGPAL